MAINDDFFFNDLCRGIFRIGYEFVLITEAVLVFNSNQHARGYPIEVLNTLYITLYYLCIILPQCPSHIERSSCSLIHDVVLVTYTEGEMIRCDNYACPMEWFPFNYVSLNDKPKSICI